MRLKNLIRVMSAHLRCVQFALAAAFIVFVAGCGYPEVSEQTYEISKALYTACNQKNSDQLQKVEALITDSLDEGKLTQREANWLNEIIGEAEAGNWEEAMSEARSIMVDQVQQ